MEYLIDTHIFLWSLLDTSKLKPHVIEILENEENKIYLSSISFWEIALKNLIICGRKIRPQKQK